MSTNPVYVGADRSAGAWFCVVFDQSGFDHAAVFDEIGALWARYEERAERILVDVPIGLIEGGESDRACDRLAREVLGPRGSCVFTPPVRAATRRRRYSAAKRVNERKSGKPLSKQAFAMGDAIAEVDHLLGNVAETTSVFAESHPEVCFRAFAGTPLERSKHTAGGYAERMRTLAGYDRDAPPTVQAAAEAAGDHDVRIDDVLDAVALAYTAAPGGGQLRSLPPDPPTDPAGLPMRIVYRSGDPLSP